MDCPRSARWRTGPMPATRTRSTRSSSELYAAQGSCELAGFEFVTKSPAARGVARSGRRAVVIVDALRLDGAFAIQNALKGHDVEIHTVRAMLPTVTPIGMTAMLPLEGVTGHIRGGGQQTAPASEWKRRRGAVQPPGIVERVRR